MNVTITITTITWLYHLHHHHPSLSSFRSVAITISITIPTGPCYFCGSYVRIGMSLPDASDANERKNRQLQLGKDSAMGMVMEAEETIIEDDPTLGGFGQDSVNLASFCQNALTGRSKDLYDRLQLAVQQRQHQ